MVEPAPQLALAAICAELERANRRFALVRGARRLGARRGALHAGRGPRRLRERRRGCRGLGLSAACGGVFATGECRTFDPPPTCSGPPAGSAEGEGDLLFASSGIEDEVVARATVVDMGSSGHLPVASAEELLALKVLSMTDARLQDRLDALRLLEFVPEIDLARVRSHLDRITERGFHREQALQAKLDGLLAQPQKQA